jgi:hypothetical protein
MGDESKSFFSLEESLAASFGDYDQVASGRITSLPTIGRLPDAQAKNIWRRVFQQSKYSSWSVADKTTVLDVCVLSAVKLTTSPLADYNVDLVISAGRAADSTTGTATAAAKVFSLQDLRDQITGDTDELRRFFGVYANLATKLLRDTSNPAVMEVRAVISRRYETNNPAYIPYCFDFALCRPELVPAAIYPWLVEHKITKTALRAAPIENGKTQEVAAEEKGRQIAAAPNMGAKAPRGLGFITG